MPTLDQDADRDDIIDALRALNAEGFSYIVGLIWQQSKHAGGFTDTGGWQRVREAAERFLKIR